MADETRTNGAEITPQSRRDIVRKAAQVAVTAPAVAVLLNASARNAFAQISPYQSTSLHILDDFTFGNNEEDVDARAFGNFNPVNGVSNQDNRVPL
jgi:hypothetical protein